MPENSIETTVLPKEMTPTKAADLVNVNNEEKLSAGLSDNQEQPEEKATPQAEENIAESERVESENIGKAKLILPTKKQYCIKKTIFFFSRGLCRAYQSSGS